LPQSSRIHRLDNRLANQIAAGEVVERPASVAKELIENSIDSGATRIEVDAERGGTRLIRITDNGKGIHKDDLVLALTRHATSKIQSTEDLGAIETLGFRGEALASISSVSRLTLTSRTQDSELAWQAIAQGRDMDVEILPAAAAAGTRVEVADLFYNTPARQKFMRTEKTEFAHLEEVFKQHALVNPHVAFVLKHNNKVVKRAPAIGDKSQAKKRISDICGKRFAENSLPINCQHEIMNISGWLGTPDFHRSESDIQYVFVNNRPVKDKTLNHAIRKAYSPLIPPGRMPTFVIFIEMDASSVDVNVHPTKHEVRFDQQRFVHDLLAKSIEEALLQFESNGELFPSSAIDDLHLAQNNLDIPAAEETMSSTSSNHQDSFKQSDVEVKPSFVESRGVEPKRESENFGAFSSLNSIPYAGSNFNSSPGVSPRGNQSKWREAISTPRKNLIRETAKYFSPSETEVEVGAGSRLVKVSDDFWIAQQNEAAIAFKLKDLLQFYFENILSHSLTPRSQPLLFPIKLSLSQAVIEAYETHQLLEKLGFDSKIADPSTIRIIKVPFWLSQLPVLLIKEEVSRWLQKVPELSSLQSFPVEDIVTLLIQKNKAVSTVELVEEIYSNLEASTKGNMDFCRSVKADLIESLFPQIEVLAK